MFLTNYATGFDIKSLRPVASTHNNNYIQDMK